MEDVKINFSLQTTIVLFQISALKSALSDEQLRQYDVFIADCKQHLLNGDTPFSQDDLKQIEALLR